MSQFDKRISVKTIVENQLPEFIVNDFPNAVELFKQYYISQEFQGGSIDLISNFDQYLKVDNLVPEVVVGIATLSSSISSTDTTISVSSTKGFPSEYGLLKIDDEIISYTGVTENSFTGCIRGFSGVTGYNVGVSSSLLDVNKQSLKFEDTSASSHTADTSISNLSVLFLQEFYKKLKKTFLPGLESNDFTENLDVGNFFKFARSFYQSKGVEESIRILFKVLYGVDATILDLETNLIKPSSSEFIRREVVIADVISSGEPQNLRGQTIFKSDHTNKGGTVIAPGITEPPTSASVSEVEVFTRDGKTYYKLSLFVGYNDRDLIQGLFTIPGKTKALSNSQVGDNIISVDSTVGFGTTGTIISGSNTIDYTSKTINQFFGCSGINVGINTADDIRANETIFGYENGDLSKRVDLRITGVLSELVTTSDVTLVSEGEHVFVKNLGEKITTNNSTYKEIFANSWKYNTSSRFQVDNITPPFILRTPIIESTLKLGDLFEILERNEQVIVGNFIVSDIDLTKNTVDTSGINFIPPFTQLNTNQNYDIRRVIEKANSTGIDISVGNENIISDVLNVYTDESKDGYVASNSLPSYDIDINIIKDKIDNGFTASSFDGLNPQTNLYSFIKFSGNTGINLIQGDAIVYQPVRKPLTGLSSGTVYYVDTPSVSQGTTQQKIALYNARTQIGTASTIQVGIGSTDPTMYDANGTIIPNVDAHEFVLQRHHNRKLDADKILRRIPLSQNLFISSKDETPVNDIGILRDGVQIHSPISDDKIYFGPLEAVEVFNGGTGYDIINPPEVVVESSTGTTALLEPILSGSVEKVFVDPQDFDIAAVTNISLTGGNGSGCVLEPVLGARFRDILFDSRNIFFNGGIDINDDTITFKSKHNLENGQVVYYRNEGNPSIGIGVAGDVSNIITGALADGDPYFVRVVNPTTIRIFNTKTDSLSGVAGINTVGLATDTAASGIHKFRTESKNTLLDVRVIESGSNYQHRKLRVNPSGISTSFDTIEFSNHGFSHGDIVEYSPTVGLGSTTPKAIQGLSTTTSYLVVKVDDDKFKLSEAGIGGTDRTNFTRGKIVGLGSTGTGYQTFRYPDIKVNVAVSYGSTVTGTINFTPVVRGEFIGGYLYDNGSDYGSTILNHQITPTISIQDGLQAELKPIISNGKIEEIIVTNQGKQYNSTPDIEITSSEGGIGAIVRPIIENGIISSVKVINSGIGYSSLSTNVRVITTGRNGLFGARVRDLTVNNTGRFGDKHLTSRENSVTFAVQGYSQDNASKLETTFDIKSNGEFDKITDHSPIIGWAYDGNPIYGPFGYSDPDNINSSLKILSSSYKTDTSKVTNRPTGFKNGFFVEDHTFDGSGDLDIHNGRFCKTPEFPNGIYAYFATVGLSTSTNKLEGVYPYFIGNTYRSPYINDNSVLTHDFDFNNSNLIRNTTPHNIGEKFADNDFIVESNEYIRQSSSIETVTKGIVENIQILDGGNNYQIGDLTSFDETNTNGSGFSAEVSEIVGIGISVIETNLERFNNSVFTWIGNKQIQVNYLPFLELNNNDTVFISGINTSIPALTDSFKVGVSTDTISLGKTMSVGNFNGTVEDIFVNKIPNTVSIGGSLRVGVGATAEMLQVLNVYNSQKIIRVFRNTGAAHTFGSQIDVLNNRFIIPLNVDKFDSKPNDIIYFNGVQSVGVGTSGVATQVNYVVGETLTKVSIPQRAIYLPNHPFVTGQKLTLTRPNVTNAELDVSPNDSAVGSFQLPFSGQLSTDVFVIKKDENNIGIVTTRAGVANTSEGLYFLGNGVSGIGSGLYNFTTNFDQVIGDVDKITTTIITKIGAANTTTHNLEEGDIVKLNVVPNIAVGIGTTTPISVRYNSEFEKLLLDPIIFAAADVETDRLDIEDHGLVTGDKVFYDGGATGLSTGSYFVYKISDRYIQLGETFNDIASSPINIVSITANTGGANQSLSKINPQIIVYKNQKLTFGLSSTTLADFDFKLFYDKELTNEYLSSQDTSTFNVVGVGTIGIGTSPDRPIVGAKLTVENTTSTPSRLYYGLTKGGFISTSDTSVINHNEILFTDSIYNGEYTISGVTSDKFNISPNVPEFLRYTDADCEILEYSTKSKKVKGAIKNFKIISSGFNYKRLPKFNSVVSDSGSDANIKILSNSIGNIDKVRIIDIGYEYSSDKTLSPEAFIPPVVNIDNLDVVNSVEIISGGVDYSSAPNLILFNPKSNTLVDDSSIQAIAPSQTISDVKVLSPINGLDSVSHRIVAINNSNGVGIGSVQTTTFPNAGVVTCFIETPTNGFVTEPFAIGDKIFVEGIQRVGEAGIGATQGGISTNTTVVGEGFNSEDHGYQFFEVENYIAGTPSKLIFNISGLTTNPGIAKTFQSGYAILINKNKYPDIRPIQTRGQFELNERLVIDQIKTDLRVVEIREDYIKIDGLDAIKKGDRVIGSISGVSAEITSVIENKAKFTIDFSNRQEYGWLDDTGKLSEDFQVIPDNDYYQNLSYSVKSTIEWDKFVNPLNRIIHPAGLKNFADTSVENNVIVGIGTTGTEVREVEATVILDVIDELKRVDAINNFDFAKDFDVLPNKSKNLQLSTKILTDFSRCISNRVLIHDDISSEFSSVGFSADTTVVETIGADFGNYLIQITDPDTLDAQFSEVVILTDEDDIILFEKTTDFTNIKLGDIKTEITTTGDKNLLFEPTDKFAKDHNIKVLKIDFNTDVIGLSTQSSSTNSIGNIKQVGVNVSTVGLGSTTTIVEFPKTDFNALYANIFVEDTVTKEINYNEVVVDFDGTDTSISQVYIDKNLSSGSAIGIITARFENDIIKLQIENNIGNELEARANVVGLGTTTAGIGTYRFAVGDQPIGAERSVRLESGYATGLGSTITYATLNKVIDTTSKSLIRVSCGETSSVHQVISIRDADDILTVQYPFVSMGSTTGIGTFGGEISGNNINLRFYPDSEFNSTIEVQSFNQIFYTPNDFDNTPPNLNYGSVSQEVFLTTYDGLEGRRANKTKFDLKFEGTPIYTKIFNPNSGILSTSTGVFTIPNHFYNTNEELTYTFDSTFIGIAATAMSIGSTTNTAGIVTTILPSTVFAKVIDENKFQLFSRPEYVSSGAAITFTGIGTGNAHKLSMNKQLTKTLIGLDGVVQQPITFTSISHTLDSNIGIGISQFVLSGIGSVQSTDVIKINEEYMKVEEVGFSSLPTGDINRSEDIAAGIATLPVVKVERGVLGIEATNHAANDVVRVHRGSFNIVDSSVYFIEPPKGNSRSRRTDTNLPFVQSNFSGRTFLRSDYTTNMLFDDVSDDFTGIGKTYSLTVGGANTAAGISTGNGVLFINGIFQTPLTTNNEGHNYQFISDTTAGVATVQFTGITSENGQFILSDFDINQNQVPRGGLIVSLGSTPGLGYAPLVGAKASLFKNSAGAITSVVGIATTSGVNYGISTAAYDNISGIITVTTNKVHGFSLERPNTVQLKDLEFSCVGYSGVTTTIFQDHDRPLFLTGIVSERTFEVQAGPSTIVHTYVGGGNAFEFFEDNTFGSGYRGGTVAIGVTDLAFEHRFVSSGIGSIRKGSFAATGANAFTATDANYESHSGLLTLTLPAHNLTTSDTVGIDTGGLVFKCSKDGFFGNHPYPRGLSITSNPNGDPIAGIQTAIRETTTNTITIFVGQGGGGGTGANITATVGAGGTLAFNIVSAGTSYVNPELIIPEPMYENLPVEGISRLGIGPTTDTGSNLLLNVEVGASRTSVGIGSTLFEINKFSISRPGHSFKVGDKFRPVGLVTAAHLSAPIQEFELEVVEIFRDKFSAWQFGEIDFIDNIKNLQDGQRVRFPLFFNGQLLSFEKDPTNATSQLIDLDAVLLVFVNGVLQNPGESYQFEGGSTITFQEPPTGETTPDANDEDKVNIFFYKGQEGVDVQIKDVQESVKIGDELRVIKRDNTGITTTQQNDRVIKQILSADLVETDIYTGLGIDAVNEKPVRWEKQKIDLVLNGQIVPKTRTSIEPQINPVSKIIGDLSTVSGKGTNPQDGIFVDDATAFLYENKRYAQSGDTKVDAIIITGDVGVGAAFTALVSNTGTITGLTTSNAGSGYSGNIDVIIAPPVGVGTTATATATVTDGVVTSTTITEVGSGYTFTNAPQVIVELPSLEKEKINTIQSVQGFTGIITGIQQTTRSGGGPALKFFFNAVNEDPNGVVAAASAVDLKVGYPILVTDTKVGNGLTSINGVNASTVGIGTTFLDNIYIVRSVPSTNSSRGEIICDVHTNSASSIAGIAVTGFHQVGSAGSTISLGQINWGTLYGANLTRSSSPISIGVTGLTVDSGLSTFPTISRKNFVSTSVRGLRSTGAIRVFGL